ncbi:MAG: class I SAM-dependent methyltransferase [Gammaproteobacteria bacterium]
MKTVTLKPGREKSLRRRHPWVFSGALQDPGLSLRSGETVRIMTAAGKAVAIGAWSPSSQLRVRVWSFDPEATIDAGFFRSRLQRALDMRETFVPPGQSACRLVNAESDGLPGLIVDRYADFLVCQILFAGTETYRQVLVEELQALVSPEGIFERSDVEVRRKEGLTPRAGVLAGEDPPEHIEITAHGLRFLVDVRKGHKTGFYLDQIPNHQVIREHARGLDVLNCFAYTGAFTVAALHAGAAGVTAIESSAEALAASAANVALNGLDQGRVENVQGDCFEVLRGYRDAGRRFDLVILDPPKFVAAAQQLQRGCRGYKDINLLALKLLKPGGVLATFSCSGHVSPELFQKIVADAAQDAGRDVRIARYLSQSPDHPVALAFPEGRYLKGLLCYA